MRRSWCSLALTLLVAACSLAPASGPSASATTTPAASTSTAKPAVTADLLYLRYRDEGRKAAWAAKDDGTGARRILEQVDGDIRALKWVGNGDRITFVVREPTHPDGAIWTAAADGTGASLYYDGRAAGCDSVFHPVFSPDDRRLALVCYGPNGSSLAVLDVATRELLVLATYRSPEFLDNPARWSATGERLAFDVLEWGPTDEFATGSRIATIAADGTEEPKYLDDFDSFAVRPAWGPGNATLIYNTYDLGAVGGDVTSDIYTMRPDGSEVQPFLMAAQVGAARLTQPQWDRLGTRVWVTAVTGDGLMIAWIDPESKRLQVLPIDGSSPEPRP